MAAAFNQSKPTDKSQHAQTLGESTYLVLLVTDVFVEVMLQLNVEEHMYFRCKAALFHTLLSLFFLSFEQK